MPNFQGSNQFQRNNPYGTVKKLTQLKKEAPISGAPTPAMNAPQRAQRRATKGGGAQQQGSSPPLVAAPPPQNEVPYQTRLAMVWADIAAEVDDPLVKLYAGLAQKQAG